MSKRIITVLLIVFTLFALAACGAQTEPQHPTQNGEPTQSEQPQTPAPAPTLESVLPGSNLGTGAEPTPDADPVSFDEAKFKEAEKYIDHDVSELYAAIGEPMDSSYATSCIGDGDDGELYYDGFTVATYRDGDRETVRDVNRNAG